MRQKARKAQNGRSQFQSTHPAWGATPRSHESGQYSCNFNPRTPRGVRQISILDFWLYYAFQSTHPAWGATASMFSVIIHQPISIHAPRVGCDSRKVKFARNHANFNPRTPRGVRPCNSAHVPLLILFQSTHPAWGATAHAGSGGCAFGISIHAPRVGCDHDLTCFQNGNSYFNPRTPRGVRRGSKRATS